MRKIGLAEAETARVEHMSTGKGRASCYGSLAFHSS